MTAATRLAIATMGYRGGGGAIATTLIEREDLVLEMNEFSVELPGTQTLVLEDLSSDMLLEMSEFVLELNDTGLELEICLD